MAPTLLPSSKKSPMSLTPLHSKSSASANDRALPPSVVTHDAAIESGAAPAGESAPENTAPPRLSDRVRDARVRAKLSKAELSRRVGVCLSAAVQWEHPNGTSPTVANLARIADIADVAFEWLATGRGPMAPVIPESDPTQPIAIRVDAFEERLLRAVREIPTHQHDLVIQFARSLAKKQ
jgi:transcriptional regulator with XRE-family HTH domain